jgi:hypothetical protein
MAPGREVQLTPLAAAHDACRYVFNGFFMSMRSKYTGDAKVS